LDDPAAPRVLLACTRSLGRGAERGGISRELLALGVPGPGTRLHCAVPPSRGDPRVSSGALSPPAAARWVGIAACSLSFLRFQRLIRARVVPGELAFLFGVRAARRPRVNLAGFLYWTTLPVICCLIPSRLFCRCLLCKVSCLFFSFNLVSFFLTLLQVELIFVLLLQVRSAPKNSSVQFAAFCPFGSLAGFAYGTKRLCPVFLAPGACRSAVFKPNALTPLLVGGTARRVIVHPSQSLPLSSLAEISHLSFPPKYPSAALCSSFIALLLC